MSVTIRDIAKLSGFSTVTVSRALFPGPNRPKVDSKTEEIIKEKAKELNYRPNRIAQALAVNKTKSIGIIVPDISSNFFTRIVKGVQEVLINDGYSLIICDSNRNETMQIKNINFLLENHVDGLIIVPTLSDFKILNELKEKKFPIIQVDEFIKDLDIDYVVTDNFKGAQEAVSYLIKKGYKKIAYLAGPQNLWSCQERLKGYKKVLEANNIPIQEKYILFTDASFKSGYEVTKKLLNFDERPEVIFTVNDTVAAGAIKAFYENDIKVPEDIAIMGFDDLEMTALMPKPLTTMHQKKYHMGKSAANILINRLKNKDLPLQKIVLEPNLIIRESS
ncbi:MAG: LacI family transcriptional regulator [Actinobacteria bacterium]|nr:LacI family transcriptional regulator [Actinomycetota bacterium]